MVVSTLWQRHLPVFRIFQAFLPYPPNQLVSSSSFSCSHSGCSSLIFLMRNFNFPSSSIFYLLFSHFSPNDSTFRTFLSFPFPTTLSHAPIARCTSSSMVLILYFFERSVLFILLSLSHWIINSLRTSTCFCYFLSCFDFPVPTQCLAYTKCSVDKC